MPKKILIKKLKGKRQYIFLFSHLKELLIKTIYNTVFFTSCLLLQIFWLKGKKCPPAIFNFCRYAYHVTTGVMQHFLSRQTLIILHSKQYSVCPSKYQDHSKHLPINIWSATNTFKWLIPLWRHLPLMRSKMYPRWQTSHYFKWKYFKN
jgi:hypothetical protein